ncbi:MAG: hypothetical protein ABI167_08765 [Nitrosospira sp.]
MKNRLENLFAVLFLIVLLTSCAQIPSLEMRQAQKTDMRMGTENARTSDDHKVLARQYETAAGQLLAEAEKKRELLQHYEERSYLYGKRAQDMQSHTWALLRKYEIAARDTRRQAAFHQRMALELTKEDYAIRVNAQKKEF